MPAANRRPAPEVPDISAAPWNNARGAVHRFLLWMRANYAGLPAEHNRTHLQTGADALQAPGMPATSDPNLGADDGEGPSYALEDHRHGVDLHATDKGDLIVYDGDEYVALPAGADGTLLTPDSTAPAGLEWDTVHSVIGYDPADLEYLAFVL